MLQIRAFRVSLIQCPKNFAQRAQRSFQFNNNYNNININNNNNDNNNNNENNDNNNNNSLGSNSDISLVEQVMNLLY